MYAHITKQKKICKKCGLEHKWTKVDVFEWFPSLITLITYSHHLKTKDYFFSMFK